MHRLPDLAETPWAGGGRIAGARAAVGVDVTGRRLLYRDSANAIASFDLVALRERTVAPAGALVALGADGVLLAVSPSGAVIESQSWGTRSWSASPGRGVHAAFAAPGARLITVRRRGADTLAVVSREAGVSLVAAVPDAVDRSASRDGDAVAFATDSGVAVLEDREPQHPWFVRLAGRPLAVAFSPSGHRLYVALRERSEVALIDRFGRRERPALALPAPASALRVDPWGRVLLARSSGGGDSAITWVVGLARERVIGRIATRWASDLPTVSEEGTLLSREGSSVVARDVGSLDSLAAVPDGARDVWLVGRWTPASASAPARQEARLTDTARAVAAPIPAPERATAWVQLSVSQNEAWARALAAELASARHPVEVVPPLRQGDGWRVLMGPYRSRHAADSAGRALGRPFWTVARGSESAARP